MGNATTTPPESPTFQSLANENNTKNLLYSLEKYLGSNQVTAKKIEDVFTCLAEENKTINATKDTVKNIKICVDIYDETPSHLCKFDVIALYWSAETIENIITTIHTYLERKYYPTKFKVERTDRMIYLNESHIHSDTIKESLINYPEDIINRGLAVYVQVHFEHQVTSTRITCRHMLIKQSENAMDCPIYHKMKQDYEWNKQNLKHLIEFIHLKDEFGEKDECKYFEECKAYKRLEEGGNNLSDLCHVKLYKHPPRTRNIDLAPNIHSLVINKSHQQNHKVYTPTKFDHAKYQFNDQNGYLNALIEEITQNAFKADLCLTDDDLEENKYSLLQIVDDKIVSYRHKSMGSPLRRDHMLALILYTGCDCNYDLCGSQRKGDYDKWKWFDYCLYNGIKKLSDRESGAFSVFSGLNNVKLDKKSIGCGYFVTFVSTSWSEQVAKAFMNGDGMMIQIDKSFKNNKDVLCCDVSWISKFPDECEILFARSAQEWDGYDAFNCKVLDESNGVQTISLK